MKQRRYRDSYRILTDVDPRTGRAREVAEYAGEYYRFAPQGPTPRRRMLRAAAFVGAYWALALLQLRLCRVTSHCLYALVPFMLGLLPGAYALMGLFTALRAGARMTVAQKESGPGRLVRATLGCGLCAALGAIGGAVFLTLGGRWPEGWTEPLLAAAASAAAWAAFAVSRRSYGAIERA